MDLLTSGRTGPLALSLQDTLLQIPETVDGNSRINICIVELHVWVHSGCLSIDNNGVVIKVMVMWLPVLEIGVDI